jgi:hypothetical protein
MDYFLWAISFAWALLAGSELPRRPQRVEKLLRAIF